MLVILESTTYPGTTDELVLPMFEASGPEGRRGFLPVLLAGARGSRQSAHTRPSTFPKWWEASRQPAPKWARCSMRQASREGGSGQFHQRRRDGEAARKHIPHDQHRPGERNGPDVRSAWASTSGKSSTRRPPSRSASCRSIPAPDWAATAFRSIRFYLSWKTQAGRHRGALHRTRRLHQRPDAAFRGRQGAERAERSIASRCEARTSTCSASPTSAISTTCANRRRWMSCICCRKRGARVTFSDPYIPKVRIDGGEEMESTRRERTARRRLRRDHHQSLEVRLSRIGQGSTSDCGHAQCVEGNQVSEYRPVVIQDRHYHA